MKPWSKHWKASKKPAKQRKYTANLPLHLARKLLSTTLSNDLHNKYKKRNTPLRKGDIVKILRGQFKKRTGKVDKILTKHQRVIIEGITLTKKNGTNTSRGNTHDKKPPSTIRSTKNLAHQQKRTPLDSTTKTRKPQAPRKYHPSSCAQKSP